jgi:hypothetical protein
LNWSTTIHASAERWNPSSFRFDRTRASFALLAEVSRRVRRRSRVPYGAYDATESAWPSFLEQVVR